MPCACNRCVANSRVLGLNEIPTSRDALRHAFRTAAKACHPDRFANDPQKFREAEELFKTAQAAYRQLIVHQREEEPRLDPFGAPPNARPNVHPDSPTDTPDTDPAPTPRPAQPPINFHGALGCFVVPDFPPRAQKIFRHHLGLANYPIAILDLALNGSFDRFLLLATHGVIVKDGSGSISLLQYHDLGRLELLDRELRGKISFWERISERIGGKIEKFTLEIFRRNDSHFYSLSGPIDDSTKLAVYRFLLSKKQQPDE
jgi:DnaJ domain